MLFGYLMRTSGDYYLSGDIMQESFTRFYKHYRHQSQEPSLLYTIARNALLVVLTVVSSLMILSELGLNIAPLLAGAGVVTVLPLLAFSAAATRIPLSTLSLLQYLGPSLQFAIGVFVYREPMPPSRLVGFALVWVALALFTTEGLRHRRRAAVRVRRGVPRRAQARRLIQTG